MFEIIFAFVFLVLLHRGLEGLVCSRGDVLRRKLIFDRATAIAFIVALLGGWIAVFSSTAIRASIAGPLFFATPVVVAGVLFFAYMSQLAFDRARMDEGS